MYTQIVRASPPITKYLRTVPANFFLFASSSLWFYLGYWSTSSSKGIIFNIININLNPGVAVVPDFIPVEVLCRPVCCNWDLNMYA